MTTTTKKQFKDSQEKPRTDGGGSGIAKPVVDILGGVLGILGGALASTGSLLTLQGTAKIGGTLAAVGGVMGGGGGVLAGVGSILSSAATTQKKSASPNSRLKSSQKESTTTVGFSAPDSYPTTAGSSTKLTVPETFATAIKGTTDIMTSTKKQSKNSQEKPSRQGSNVAPTINSTIYDLPKNTTSGCQMANPGSTEVQHLMFYYLQSLNNYLHVYCSTNACLAGAETQSGWDAFMSSVSSSSHMSTQD